MHAHAAEIFRSGFLIERDEVLGIELIGFPGGNHVLEAELGRMAVRLDMVVVLRLALDIHVAGVPVSDLRLRLWSPMRPDPKLGVAVPGGNLPLLKRFAPALKRPRRDVQLHIDGPRTPENRGRGMAASAWRLVSVITFLLVRITEKPELSQKCLASSVAPRAGRWAAPQSPRHRRAL